MPVALKAQENGEKDASEKSLLEFSKALETEFSALKTAESQKDKKSIAVRFGNIGRIYLDIAKKPPEDIKKTDLIDTDRKANLNKSIEYSYNSIQESDDIGDVEQMKIAYKNLS